MTIQTGWPVNSSGQIVIEGSGESVVGVVSEDYLPVGVGGGVLFTPVTGSIPAIQQATSRLLSSIDNGKVLELTATPITLTIPSSLPDGFSVVIIPNTLCTIASQGGTLLNGSTSSLNRTFSSNVMFAIQQRATSVNSYIISGS